MMAKDHSGSDSRSDDWMVLNSLKGITYSPAQYGLFHEILSGI